VHVWANLFFHTYDTPAGPRTVYHAMPILLGVLAVLAIAYRYYSAFLAARVAVIDDLRTTPAHLFNDGQNYHPTKKWVLFGHHFAAISGAGPLIGPVLAIQYGYMPGLLWLLVGVCFAGAVQDMLVLAASVRCGGKSLAEIARNELGRPAAIVVSAAILFIVIVALAGLGFVVVKALGGEQIPVSGTRFVLPPGTQPQQDPEKSDSDNIVWRFPDGCLVRDRKDDPVYHRQSEGVLIRVPRSSFLYAVTNDLPAQAAPGSSWVDLPAGSAEIVPGSSWGTFTIACTIPIALFVGLYMYRLRKGKVVEASLFGAAGVLLAVIVGKWIPGSPLERYFALSRESTIFALCGYGFIASVLPVWLLLCPRDYLSSFLKIGTIALLVIGVLLANPPLFCPQVNEVFASGGPTFAGSIFPFVFICIMCGAISGFHALVSSGTTPKMIDRESHLRTIGYGSMLMEGLVGVVALIAAASLDPELYYGMNVDRRKVPEFRNQLDEMYKKYPPPLATGGLHDLRVEKKRDIAEVNRMVGGGESIRGRTGGAVTLAVGMALIFDDALAWTGIDSANIIQYWYHFAIMFEALFILTTIDTGTRIARFLLQEALGKVMPRFEQTDWLPGAALATAIVTFGWGALVWTGSIDTIWPMFGIANQLLAVIALCLVTTWLVNQGRARYAPVTLLPMLFVTTTTLTAGSQLIVRWLGNIADLSASWTGSADQTEALIKNWLNVAFSLFIILSVLTLLFMASARWILSGLRLRAKPQAKGANHEPWTPGHPR
jgi:carbon starvation protein